MHYSNDLFDYYDSQDLSGIISSIKKGVKKVTKAIAAPSKKILQKAGVYDAVKNVGQKLEPLIKPVIAGAAIIATGGALAPSVMGTIGPLFSQGMTAAKTFIATNAVKGVTLAKDKIKEELVSKGKAALESTVNRVLNSEEIQALEREAERAIASTNLDGLQRLITKASEIVRRRPVINNDSDYRINDEDRHRMAEMAAELLPVLNEPGIRSQYNRLEAARIETDEAMAAYDRGRNAIGPNPLVTKANGIKPRVNSISNRSDYQIADQDRKRMAEMAAEMLPHLNEKGVRDAFNRIENDRINIDQMMEDFDRSGGQTQKLPGSGNNTALIIGAGILASLLMG